MSRWVKSLLGWVALQTGIHRLFLRNRAIIVLFHRVGLGAPGDAIGCDERKFIRFCNVFKRHFTVVSLETLLGQIRRGEDLTGHLAITFDDGYLDNYTVASRLLRERDLPACFFIATGYIGTDRIPGWDRDKEIRSHWMTWDHVRQLHELGFEIGAHTVNHINLGEAESFAMFRAPPLPEHWGVDVTPDSAIREIRESKDHLERELSSPIRFFSYPFGRRENISQQNRDAVRNSGFDCCLAAYGGTVDHKSPLYELPRIPVSNWHVSPSHFVLEAIRAQ